MSTLIEDSKFYYLPGVLNDGNMFASIPHTLYFRPDGKKLYFLTHGNEEEDGSGIDVPQPHGDATTQKL